MGVAKPASGQSWPKNEKAVNSKSSLQKPNQKRVFRVFPCLPRVFTPGPKNGLWGQKTGSRGPRGQNRGVPGGIKKRANLGAPWGGGLFGNLSGFAMGNNRIDLGENGLRGVKKQGPGGSKNGQIWGPELGGGFRKFIRVCNGKQQDKTTEKKTFSGVKKPRIRTKRDQIGPRVIGNHSGIRGSGLLAEVMENRAKYIGRSNGDYWPQ